MLTISSVHMLVFFMRIISTVATMDANLVLNYFFFGARQMELLRDCQKDMNKHGQNGACLFVGSWVVLVIYLLHYTNYEINQYTYVILYDEKWPELTFYIVFYFIEMITIMNALYYDSILTVLCRTVQLDCARLSKCIMQGSDSELCTQDDSNWWSIIEYFYDRVVIFHRRRRTFCRTFELQLILIALNTFICSFSIFYVNMNSLLLITHNKWLEKYKRVTESLGFFSYLGALLLICRHASDLIREQRKLVRLIVQTQWKLTRSSSNMERLNEFNCRIYMLNDQTQIAPYNLFSIDMGFFFGTVAGIVTYLVVLLQFREMERNI